MGYVLVEYYRPKPIDWTPTYSNRDKIPYGTRMLYELLPEVFHNQRIRSIRLPVYNLLKEEKLPETSSYVFINFSFEIDKNDLKALLEYAHRGNNVFIAAERFGRNIEDTLQFETDSKFSNLAKQEGHINFLNPQLRQKKPYVLARGTTERLFRLTDSLNTRKAVALGINDRDSINFLKIPFGEGQFYLHAEPRAFINLTLNKPNVSDYAFKALSYLPEAPIYWDEYQKQGREGNTSVFRVIYSKPALKWAYYLALIGMVGYIIFEGKRRQRIIPIIKPPQNTSLAFVETIGTLYYEKRNHQNIAEKKITHLLAFIRQRFNLKTNVLDEEFKEALLHKSGLQASAIEALFNMIENTQKFGSISEYQLIDLNNKIEEFYQNV